MQAYISWLNLVIIFVASKKDQHGTRHVKKKSSQANLLLSSICIARRMKEEGSIPKKWRAIVRGLTRLSKSSMVSAYSVVAWTRPLYLLLSGGHFFAAWTNTARLEMDNDKKTLTKYYAPNFEVPHRWSNLGTSPLNVVRRSLPTITQYKEVFGLPISKKQRKINDDPSLLDPRNKFIIPEFFQFC